MFPFPKKRAFQGLTVVNIAQTRLNCTLLNVAYSIDILHRPGLLGTVTVYRLIITFDRFHKQ